MFQSVKNPPAVWNTICNAWNPGSIPGSGRSLGRGNGKKGRKGKRSRDLRYSMVSVINNTVLYTWNFSQRIDLKCSSLPKTHTHTHKTVTTWGDGSFSFIVVTISQCVCVCVCVYQNTTLYTLNIYNFYLYFQFYLYLKFYNFQLYLNNSGKRRGFLKNKSISCVTADSLASLQKKIWKLEVQVNLFFKT